MPGKLEGQVVSISDTGAAITDISLDRLNGIPTDDSVSVSCEGHTTYRLFSCDDEQAAMTFVAIQGTSGFLELCLVGDSVQAFLGIGPGSSVAVKW